MFRPPGRAPGGFFEAISPTSPRSEWRLIRSALIKRRDWGSGAFEGDPAMRGRRFLTLAAVATALTAGASAFAAEPRAVIELFTSQGCSACPPADKLLGDLAKDPKV